MRAEYAADTRQSEGHRILFVVIAVEFVHHLGVEVRISLGRFFIGLCVD